MSENILLTPFNIGKETIKNRFVMGPMGGAKFFDYRGNFTQDGIDFYVERAKGGFGLIVTGALGVDTKVDRFDPVNSMSPLFAPGQFMNSANTLNERVNAYGTKIIAEISLLVGRNYPTFKAPSAVECYNYPMFKSIELTTDEIHMKRDQAIQAAALMKKSGFMGVDLHSLHWGYLLDQFAMSITNHREDEYGGCLENRLRLVNEIVQGIHQTCGADYPVTIGLSVKSFIKALNKASLHGEEEAGRTLEEAIQIAQMLEKMGIAAIMTDTGIYDSFYYACPPSYMPQGHGLPLYAEVKKAVNIPILARSRMGNAKLCEDAVNAGQCDAVVLARPSLADPFFPRKIEMGVPEKIRPCIGCNMGCIGPLLEKGVGAQCAVNPRAFKETYTKPKKSVNPRNIAVVGGGAAGMEAALTAAECGHKVELYEKSSVLGGELNAAGAHAFKCEIHQFRDWLIRELDEKKVPIHMNSEFTPEMAAEKGIDTVILATGASPVMPASIKGIEKAVSAVDLLEGKCTAGENVVIVGGGMVGCETAVELAGQGKKVTLVEALPKILSAEFVPQQHKGMLNDLLADKKVEIIAGHKLVEVTDQGVVVESVADGTSRTVPADTSVLSIGMRPNKSLAPEFYGKDIAVYEIGSARRSGNVINAVRDAFEVVYNFD